MKTRLQFLYAVTLFALLGLFGCSQRQTNPDLNVAPAVSFRDDGRLTFVRNMNGAEEELVAITIEIADTDTLRMRGLMDRVSIPSERGMLFIFPVAEMQGFWMANTQSSLDILFVSADSVINDIHKYTKPLSPATVAGREPAQYVVEVVAGFVDNEGIVVGDRIRWTRSN